MNKIEKGSKQRIIPKTINQAHRLMARAIK